MPTPALVSALYYLVFLVGGPGHMAALGLLVAGIAGPSLRLGLIAQPSLDRLGDRGPCRIGDVGVGLAAAGVLLPIARVSALGWLVVVGAAIGK